MDRVLSNDIARLLEQCTATRQRPPSLFGRRPSLAPAPALTEPTMPPDSAVADIPSDMKDGPEMGGIDPDDW